MRASAEPFFHPPGALSAACPSGSESMLGVWISFLRPTHQRALPLPLSLPPSLPTQIHTHTHSLSPHPDKWGKSSRSLLPHTHTIPPPHPHFSSLSCCPIPEQEVEYLSPASSPSPAPPRWCRLLLGAVAGALRRGRNGNASLTAAPLSAADPSSFSKPRCPRLSAYLRAFLFCVCFFFSCPLLNRDKYRVHLVCKL